MANERVVPTSESSDLPTFTILSGSTEINGTHHVMSILVLKQVNRISLAQVVLKDGNFSTEDFLLSNSDLFVPGKEVEIKAGYHSKNETIFKGIIIKHGIKVRKDNGSMLVLEMRDKAVKMTIGRKSAYYYETADSEITEGIIQKHGLTAGVKSTTLKHKEMVQYHCSDWDFIMSRAEANGRLVFTEDGNVSVQEPDLSLSPVLTLVLGASMLSFEAEMDARTQFTDIKASSWDFSSQSIIEEDAEEPSFPEHGNLQATDLADVIGLDAFQYKHSGHVVDGELKEWSNAAMQKSRLGKVRGRAKCTGFSGIKPGQVLELKGVGNRFNGNAFVAAVRHDLGPGNWETNIEFGLSPEWFAKNQDIIDAPSAGLLPAIQGLHIGVVTKLGADPDGEDRVQVRVPMISDQDDGVWARVATLDAGSNRGSFFRPEVDDEVILGFINDDPRDAVILGMLNSSAKPAPLPASDQNPQKGFITRSELKLIFDDGKKSILIETPGGNQFLLDDDEGSILLKDKNDNTIKMFSDGIKIESGKDLILKATGDLKMEGVNISTEASAEWKAEGSAGSKLSSGAMTEIKGSLVQIN